MLLHGTFIVIGEYCSGSAEHVPQSLSRISWGCSTPKALQVLSANASVSVPYPDTVHQSWHTMYHIYQYCQDHKFGENGSCLIGVVKVLTDMARKSHLYIFANNNLLGTLSVNYSIQFDTHTVISSTTVTHFLVCHTHTSMTSRCPLHNIFCPLPHRHQRLTSCAPTQACLTTLSAEVPGACPHGGLVMRSHHHHCVLPVLVCDAPRPCRHTQPAGGDLHGCMHAQCTAEAADNTRGRSGTGGDAVGQLKPSDYGTWPVGSPWRRAHRVRSVGSRLVCMHPSCRACRRRWGLATRGWGIAVLVCVRTCVCMHAGGGLAGAQEGEFWRCCTLCGLALGLQFCWLVCSCVHLVGGLLIGCGLHGWTSVLRLLGATGTHRGVRIGRYYPFALKLIDVSAARG